MSAEPPYDPVLRGQRVVVRRVRPGDAEAYRAAVIRSVPRIRRWNPADPDAFPGVLAAQSPDHHTFLVLDAATGELAGKVNLTSIVRGRFRSGALGYDAFDPYAGTGRMGEGLALVVAHALRAEADAGIGLHRVEAVVQPDNVDSAGLLRRLGFRREGRSPRLLWVPHPGERDAWRDHDRYAITAEEWPATPYAEVARPRPLVVVNGLPGSGKSTLAPALAAELGLPLLAKDAVKEALADALRAGRLGAGSPDADSVALGAAAMDVLFRLAADATAGAVLEGFWWDARDEEHLRDGLRRAGADPGRVPEVWCDVPWETAWTRFAARAPQRHPVHGARLLDRAWWAEHLAGARPVGLGPVVRVDTSVALTPRTVVRAALDAAASA